MVPNNALEPCDFVLFGTKGDLARRKLLPSMYQLEKIGLMHEGTKIIGVARYEHSVEDYVEQVRDNLNTFLNEEICEETWSRLKAKLDYVQIDMKNIDSYSALQSHVDAGRTMVCYLATPPSIYGDICKGLNAADVIDESVRVVLEKPIGHDLESSKVINNQVAEFFQENQIYRIDHYLGKETVLNLIALRFANAIFTNNWDHNCIDHVQITVAESVGIEGRWGYFDEAGQTRDMIQNHLLQILTLIAMEPPASVDADSIRDEKMKVLKALRPINKDNVADNTVRGQYTAGYVKGEEVPGYLEEEGANTESSTESFVALKVELDNWRWAGVPFYLRTGKRMQTKVSEVVIYFKRQPHNLFSDSFAKLPSNKLTIRLQPDEGVQITVMNKVPGLGGEAAMNLQKSKLNLSFSEAFKSDRIPDAYEKLLLEVMLGDQSLFVRRDEIEQAWTWVDGIFEAWKTNNEEPDGYPAGSWGPTSAIAMMARDDRGWYDSTSKLKKS